MTDFRESAWADNKFVQNYLEKADIYVVERRKMLWFVSSLFIYFIKERNVKLLDLGCGDGIVTEQLFKTERSISATLIDGSKSMLLKAKERLKAFPLVNFVRASFQEILGGSVELESYDFCISSMAIHHLEMNEKESLFQLISSHLKPGGHFVNIDIVRAPSEELEVWYFDVWKDWIGHMMNRFNIKDEMPEDVIKKYQDSSSMNKPDTLGSQLKALCAVGFTDVDCYFKNGLFVVFGGKKK